MFTSRIVDTERERLVNGFPVELRQDVEKAINVLPFVRSVKLADGQIHQVDSLIHPDERQVFLNGEVLTIPSRLYFNEPPEGIEGQLTASEKIILNCIYLRHHNGFVRQRRLQQLLQTSDYFVIPYTFQLLGEYVMEILHVLDQHINEKTSDQYGNFIIENKKYWQQTESRMISYWNEYYRRQTPKLKDYVGKIIVDKLKKSERTISVL